MLALHSIELALSAALKASGMGADSIRAMRHDCAKRAQSLEEMQVVRWKQRTIAHIKALSADRHYLKCRYDAGSLPLVPPSRIEATLGEILDKAKRIVESAKPS